MVFNSIDFAVFLPVVFVSYWYGAKNIRQQNLLLIVASYFFYGYWDWRFLSLILFSTMVDFFIGISLSKETNQNRRGLLLGVSILVNIGLLGVFKYYNFFAQNFVSAFLFLGCEFDVNTINIVLPVGISFYTFQTISYTIDVYKRKLDSTRNFVAFCAFVSFFPQLVAGPIERATNLLTQFYYKRIFDYTRAVNGMRQILWGLFKKVVIADNCAKYANEIFNNSLDYSGSTLMVGALFFTFQIYGDFSGYSDIAIGTAKLFGFKLQQNFAFPYFSRDIGEFWRRWHMSLSSWFRDYLYIPLGGSRGSTMVKVRNIFLIFVISGFWHGANWNFIAWGILNAILFLPLVLFNKNRNHINVVAQGDYFPSLKEFLLMTMTFTLVVFAWIFFRAQDISHAFSYISGIFSMSLFTIPEVRPRNVAIIICVFMSIEWAGREDRYAIEKIGLRWMRPIRHAFYYAIIVSIIWFGGEQQDFIYFQF